MSGVKEQAGIRKVAEVDRIVHEPARLMILMVLYSLKRADFVFLTNATELTWGNLSSHLTRLETAGYVKIEKGYAGKRPRTLVEITDAGREAVQTYRKTMQSALANLKES